MNTSTIAAPEFGAGDPNSLFSYYTALLANPIFFGGFGVTVIGFLGYYLSLIYNAVWNAVWRQFVRTLEIDKECIVYEWVMEHINSKSKWQTNNLCLKSELAHDHSGTSSLALKFLPGEGTHYFLYKNQWIEVERTREKESDFSGRERERLKLTTHRGYSDFWKNFIEEASREGLDKLKKGLSFSRVHKDYDDEYCWKTEDKPRKKRTLDSVILDDGVLDRLTADIQEFLDSEEWYAEMGVPYRRGYLLFGPPGTGKTSVILAIASHFGFNVCRIAMSNAQMGDEDFNNLLNSPPDRSIILLEDIDVAFHKRNKDDDNSSSDEDDEDKKKTELKKKDGQRTKIKCKVTLSGILNAIDGVGSCEKRIIFMTTNYKEQLDSALIRPGRVDYEEHFGFCTPSMIERMFKRFYNRASEMQWEQFQEGISRQEKPITPAQLQRHFIWYKNNVQSAIRNLDRIHT